MRLWPASVVGSGWSPPLRHACPCSPKCPLSLPGLSLSPSRYKAWESQAREIRSQFQPVPTERSYQDGTCRMEYFKLYLSRDRGRPIAAPSRRCGGGAGREVAARCPDRAPNHPPPGHPGGHPLLGRTPGAQVETRGPGPPAEIRLRRAWHTARGARRGVKVAGAGGQNWDGRPRGGGARRRGADGGRAGCRDRGQSLTHA
jgi:hypothetical protein